MSRCPYRAGMWLVHARFGLARIPLDCAPVNVAFDDWCFELLTWPHGERFRAKASECCVALPPAQFRKPRLIAVDGRMVEA